MNTDKLAKDFEKWAENYWAQGLDTEWMAEHGAYADETVQTAWLAYQAAHGSQQELLDMAQATIDDLCEQLDSIEAGHKGMC